MYGSLRPALGHYMQRYLRAFAEHLGPATAKGQIYDLGSYPGFIEGPGLVQGDLFEIKNPRRLLPPLDLYEGDEYERKFLSIRDGSGAEGTAWIYIYTREPGNQRLIESGDYVHYRLNRSEDD